MDMRFYKLLHIALTAVLLAVASVPAEAAPVDEVRRLYEAGKYDAALQAVTPLLKKSPREAAYNYYAGACRYELGQHKQGEELLQTAVKRGSADAALMLADIALAEYRVDDAEDYIDEYEAIMSKNRKAKPDKERLAELNASLVMLRNMLDRVERIAVIDSVNVPRKDFFRYYRLSPESGRIAPGTVLPAAAGDASAQVVYIPENEIELLWAAPDSSGRTVLMSADRLADGTITPATPLGGDLNDGGDADFPFMMPDGVTLYYAANGDNSLGGYDIFMTRRDDDGFLQPQNVGMPYNSPYDDYMLAIDEVTGVGWWASDRNQLADSVTIYIYVPNEMRSNYPADDPDVASLAMLRSIAMTQTPGADYSALRRAIASIEPASSSTDSRAQFRFEIPGKGVYTSLDNFTSPRARSLMEQYIERSAEFARTERHLQLLRKAYAGGNLGVSDEIRRLENTLDSSREALMKAQNAVIEAER